MKFSYNWLKQYVKLPKPEKLAEILTMHSFEVEGMEKIKSDHILDIDVLPNRGSDCFSHIGIAREIAAVTNVKMNIPELKLKEDKKNYAKDLISVYVDEKKDCGRYSVRVMTNVKIKESPKQIKNKLIACGLKPINNIVDATNYVMLETGQPLHAFDLDKINNRIIIRKAKKGERIVSLDNKKYNLDKDILVIADAKEPLAVAGIKGGRKAEIDKNTKNIVIESANFDSGLIRRASQKISLKTDASWRFEHKINTDLTTIALNRVVNLIDGKIAKGIVDIYNFKSKPQKIKLDINYVRKLLGIEISEKEIKDILERLGFKYTKGIVQIPEFRLDISLPEDLIEEVGRIYGYEKITSVFPIASLVSGQRNFNIFWKDVSKNILKELGFTEVYNYSFISDYDVRIFGYNDSEIIELENPISSEQKYLRPSLIPNLLKNIESNFKNFNEIKIFELGKVFTNRGEKKMLTGLIAKKSSDKSDFYVLKGIVDSLLNKLGISDIYYDEYKATPEDSKIFIWQKGKTAEIQANGKEIGFLGEISSKLLKKGKAIIFDIDFEKLSKLSSEESEYKPISQYPSAVRDLAILVPLQIQVVEVMNIMNITGGKLVKDIDLFDIYEGESIPQGKKNLAFHIIYQAKDKTLTNIEIDELQNKIIKALEQNPQWQVRK